MSLFDIIKTEKCNHYIVKKDSSYISFLPSKYLHDDSDYYKMKLEYLGKMNVCKLNINQDYNSCFTESDIIKYLANSYQLTFEVTNACNLQCVYCAYGKIYGNYDARNNEKMSIRIAYSMLDYLSSLWKSKSNYSNGCFDIGFYGGEPLLNFDFIMKVVEYVEKIDHPFRKITYSMTTNAVLLDKYMDYLYEKDFNLLISLDGDSNGSSLRVDKKGCSSFEKVVKNIDLLSCKYPEYFKNKVNFNSVISKVNSFESSQSYIKNRYNKNSKVSDINSLGVVDEAGFDAIYNPIKSEIKEDRFNDIQSDMGILAPDIISYIRFVKKYSNCFYNNYTELFYSNTENRFPTGTCLPFSRKIYVTVKGKILPCERIGQEYSFGNCTQNGVSINTKNIQMFYNSRLKLLEPFCEKCFNRMDCTECLFYITGADGKFNCKGFMSKRRWIDKIKKNLDISESRIFNYKNIVKRYKIV